jgi:hypothetical protein
MSLQREFLHAVEEFAPEKHSHRQLFGPMFSAPMRALALASRYHTIGW